MKKNVIWVFGDQHRSQALSINGDPNVRTPNIDNLAVGGVHYTNALSGSPLCTPARGSILTSRYPHGCAPGHEYQMPENQETIADVFNEAGYDTAYFGKWHLDGYKGATRHGNRRASHHIVPLHRRGGFKTWIGYENNNSQYDCWVHGGEGEGAFHYRLPGFETDELTNLLLQYIETKGKNKQSGEEEPFFAVLSAQPPHDPYQAPVSFRKGHTAADVELRENVPNVKRIMDKAKEDLSGYYPMIENLDWNLGRVRQMLHDTNLEFDTHIIFFSDHGDLHGSHGQFKKTSPYEESIRIPFIIGGEPAFYEGSKTGKCSVPLNHVDVAPTTLGLCGITKPQWMEGTDYSFYRFGGVKTADEPDSAFLQSVVPTKHPDSVDKPWRGIVTKDRWKYISFEGVPWLMFNLNEDPYEQVNLAHNTLYSDKKIALNNRLRKWIEDTGDTFNLSVIEKPMEE